MANFYALNTAFDYTKYTFPTSQPIRTQTGCSSFTLGTAGSTQTMQVSGCGLRDSNGDKVLDSGLLGHAIAYTGSQQLFAFTGINKQVFNAAKLGYVVDGKTVYGALAQQAYWLSGNDNLTGSMNNDRLAGFAGNDRLFGWYGDDRLEGGAGNDELIGGMGNDTLYGGSGADRFVFDCNFGTDRIADFLSGSDKLVFDDSALRGIGDGDGLLDGGLLRNARGGFHASAELVVFSRNITGEITNQSAAATIGSASEAFAFRDQRIFAVDNGTQTNVYLFRSTDSDAMVESHELTLIGTVNGQTSLGDYLFQQ